MDAKKARGKNSKKTRSVDEGLKYIKNLYSIETRAKKMGLSAQELLLFRESEAKPILDDMHKWLEKKSFQVVPKSLLGRAISYTLNQWHRLIGYIDSEYATPDNNLAENAIRPFCVGRKNWLFAGNPKGAQASAMIYSLLESAKANKLEPYKYLRYLFENLPTAETEEDYRKLLPSSLSVAELETVSGVSRV
jgi:transposase